MIVPVAAGGITDVVGRVVADRMTKSIGQHVRARNINPVTHTRLPRYVRGKAGTIERDRGVATLPDTNVYGLGEKPQHVYSVRFSARELWGDDADPSIRVSIEAFEPYLTAA